MPRGARGEPSPPVSVVPQGPSGVDSALHLSTRRLEVQLRRKAQSARKVAQSAEEPCGMPSRRRALDVGRL